MSNMSDIRLVASCIKAKDVDIWLENLPFRLRPEVIDHVLSQSLSSDYILWSVDTGFIFWNVKELKY